MKRLAAIIIVTIGLCGSVEAQNSFNYYWPFIRNALTTNSSVSSNCLTWINLFGYQAVTNSAIATNWIASTGAQASADATYSTNWIAHYSPPAGEDGHPCVGIWQLSYDHVLTPATYWLAIEAGKWRINAANEIVPSTNTWEDGLWETNAVGEVIARSLSP